MKEITIREGRIHICDKKGDDINGYDTERLVTLLNTKNVVKAVSELMSYTTSYHIYIGKIEDMATDYPTHFTKTHFFISRVVHDSDKERIVIYLSDMSTEESFIHEIIHIILAYKGFPDIILNEECLRRKYLERKEKLEDVNLINMRNTATEISSIIQHPEVYRIMKSEYCIDLDHELRLQQHIKILEQSMYMTNQYADQYHFIMQQLILKGLECFFWNDKGEKFLKLFKENYPRVYSSSKSLFDKVKKIGFATPEQSSASANMIKRHIVNYGERNHLPKIDIDMWNCLEISYPDICG